MVSLSHSALHKDTTEMHVFSVNLCIPEHSMHMVTPKLMEAQRGSSSPQSQHTWFPGPLRATSSAAGLWAGVGPAPEDASPLVGGGGSSLGCKGFDSESHQEEKLLTDRQTDSEPLDSPSLTLPCVLMCKVYGIIAR